MMQGMDLNVIKMYLVEMALYVLIVQSYNKHSYALIR